MLATSPKEATLLAAERKGSISQSYRGGSRSTIQDPEIINKIKVTPKRITEPAMEGYIYIVDDSWEIYAVDLSITEKCVVWSLS